MPSSGGNLFLHHGASAAFVNGHIHFMPTLILTLPEGGMGTPKALYPLSSRPSWRSRSAGKAIQCPTGRLFRSWSRCSPSKPCWSCPKMRSRSLRSVQRFRRCSFRPLQRSPYPLRFHFRTRCQTGRSIAGTTARRKIHHCLDVNSIT